MKFHRWTSVSYDPETIFNNQYVNCTDSYGLETIFNQMMNIKCTSFYSYIGQWNSLHIVHYVADNTPISNFRALHELDLLIQKQWQHSMECMCRLRNIALESVTEKCDRQTDRQTDGRTDGQTDGRTNDGQSDPYVSLCFAGDTKINRAHI